MANPVRGEVDFVAGEKTYTIKLGHNARATAEGMLDKLFSEIVQELLSGKGVTRYETAIVVLFSAMHQAHPDLTLDDIGDLMDLVGDEYVGVKLTEALVLSSPKPQPGASPRPPQRPKRKAGTTNSLRGRR